MQTCEGVWCGERVGWWGSSWHRRGCRGFGSCTAHSQSRGSRVPTWAERLRSRLAASRSTRTRRTRSPRTRTTLRCLRRCCPRHWTTPSMCRRRCIPRKARHRQAPGPEWPARASARGGLHGGLRSRGDQPDARAGGLRLAPFVCCHARRPGSGIRRGELGAGGGVGGGPQHGQRGMARPITSSASAARASPSSYGVRQMANLSAGGCARTLRENASIPQRPA